MNKKKVSVILAIFFLVQAIPFSQGLSQENCLLNPPTKVSLAEPDIYLQQRYYVVCLALSIYKKDAFEKGSVETLIGQFGDRSFNQRVRFDMSHMKRKGWTRYYPVFIDEKPFIVRVFLTEELIYQPKVKVLFEASIKNPPVTLQILPGINAVLADCKIKPYNTRLSSQVDSSL